MILIHLPVVLNVLCYVLFLLKSNSYCLLQIRNYQFSQLQRALKHWQSRAACNVESKILDFGLSVTYYSSNMDRVIGLTTLMVNVII